MAPKETESLNISTKDTMNSDRHHREVILLGLPPVTPEVKGMWHKGYPVHKGESESSVNFATLYAKKNNIIPDQNLLRREWLHFVDTLLLAGFQLRIIPFPEELNKPNSLYHDAVFIRDGGMIFRSIWIKGRFSVKDRITEGEFHTKCIAAKLKKTIISVPRDALLEGGDINFLKTANGSYYFGGLSRSNKKGHDFVRDIVRPDNYILVESDGYHLDTVFTPVVSAENKLVALIIASDSIKAKSMAQIRGLGVPVLEVSAQDSSGSGDTLGDYSVNALIAPGVMVNCSRFSTPGVEDKLKKLGIERFVSPLTSFKYAGGSVHCLTNEVY
jgi:N-dimethylarginine dimethylaminohydrolase